MSISRQSPAKPSCEPRTQLAKLGAKEAQSTQAINLLGLQAALGLHNAGNKQRDTAQVQGCAAVGLSKGVRDLVYYEYIQFYHFMS